MKKYLLLSLIMLSGIIICWGFKDEFFSKSKNISGNKQGKKTKAPQLIISIQPFSDISHDKVNYVASELNKVYSKVEVKQPIPLPGYCKNYDKSRYRADSLIRYLKNRTPKGYLTIGLTTRDVSATKGKDADFGIMGLGYRPGNSCIASLFRLKGDNKLEKLYKVAIHELGHTNGLPHCPVKTCLMRNAEGKDHLNEQKEFCVNCKATLIKAGWAFK